MCGFRKRSKWSLGIVRLANGSISISGRELMVLTHEGLESQKEFYKVNFESTFAKPLALKK